MKKGQRVNIYHCFFHSHPVIHLNLYDNKYDFEEIYKKELWWNQITQAYYCSHHHSLKGVAGESE